MGVADHHALVFDEDDRGQGVIRDMNETHTKPNNDQKHNDQPELIGEEETHTTNDPADQADQISDLAIRLFCTNCCQITKTNVQISEDCLYVRQCVVGELELRS